MARPKKIVTEEKEPPLNMPTPVSISVAYTRNGIREVYVLYSDGSIKMQRDTGGGEQVTLS